MDGGSMGLVSVRKGAALLGLNPSTVSRQLRKFEADGRLKTRAVNGEKLFDLDAFRAAAGAMNNPLMARNGGAASPAASGPSAPMLPGPGLTTAATAHKALQARLLEHELAVKTGRVIERAAVVSVLQGASRELRDALLALPARVKGELASMTEPAEIQRFLDGRVQELVAGFAVRFAALGSENDEPIQDAAE